MDPDLDLDEKPEGLLVRASDGRVFFLPESEQERFAVSTEHHAVTEKLFFGSGNNGPVAHPSASCKLIWDYMMSHDPNNITWRRVSVLWMRDC